MLTTVILQLALAGMTHAPATLDIQATQASAGARAENYTVAYSGPVHGPDPDREVHDYGMPSNNPDPYGGTTHNGADPYGGRYGGSDPYGGKTGNNLGPYGR